MTTVEPWSGHYEVNPVIWATAHFGQLTCFLTHGAGKVEVWCFCGVIKELLKLSKTSVNQENFRYLVWSLQPKFDRTWIKFLWVSRCHVRHVTQFTEVGWKYLLNGSGSGELPNGGYYATWVDPNSTHFTMNMVKISRAWHWTCETKSELAAGWWLDAKNPHLFKCLFGMFQGDHAQCTRPPLPNFKVKEDQLQLQNFLSHDCRVFCCFFIAKSIRILSHLFIWNWPGNGNGTLSSIYESTCSAASVAPGLTFESMSLCGGVWKNF